MSRRLEPAVRLDRLDALILLTAIALGVTVWAIPPVRLEAALRLGISRAEFEKVLSLSAAGRLWKPLTAQPLIGTWPDRLLAGRLIALDLGGKVLPFATLGLSVAVLRHRDGRGRRALRRVGILTAAAVAPFMAASIATEWALRRFTTLRVGFGHNPLDSIWFDIATDTGLSVAAFWVVLALGRRWRTDRGWADRLGRFLGAGWIAHLALGDLLQRLLT